MSNDLTTKKPFDLESLSKSLTEHVVICIDGSTSMDGMLSREDYGTSRAKAAVEAVKQLLHSSDARRTEYSVVHFQSSHSDKPAARLTLKKTNKYTKILLSLSPVADHGTDMAAGLEVSLLQNPNRIILLSDGEPTCSRYAIDDMIQRAITGGVRIDTVGIGEANPGFMASIAERTGGTYTRCDTLAQLKDAYKQLETKLYYLTHHKA